MVTKFLSKTLTQIFYQKNRMCHRRFTTTGIRWNKVKCDHGKTQEGRGPNLSVVLHGIKDLKFEDRPIPKIKANQVLLQMEVVGICGSDVHFYENGKIGHLALKGPMVMGHEGAGTVIECGEKVRTLKPGDRVAIEPGINCKECEYCKTGKYNLCPRLVFCASPPYDGFLSRYFAHDADFCYKLPDNMSCEEGVLMEPFAVAVHACTRGEIKNGDHVLITGAGTIGLCTLLATKAFGASSVLITDRNDFKLKKAMELGASRSLNVINLDEKCLYDRIISILGKPPDKCIECSGNPSAVKTCVKVTRSGGKVMLVGLGKEEVEVPIPDILIREVDFIGSFRFVNNYATAIDMVAKGRVDVKPLITHHFRMEDAMKAFDLARKNEPTTIKIMIHTNSKWKPEEEC